MGCSNDNRSGPPNPHQHGKTATQQRDRSNAANGALPYMEFLPKTVPIEAMLRTPEPSQS